MSSAGSMGRGLPGCSTYALGRSGEEAAAVFLQSLEWEVLGRNVRTPEGEIDLICSDKGTLVVVEVKSRRSIRSGCARESVDERKMRRLMRSLSSWLATRAGRSPCPPLRFDLVTVELDPVGLPLSLRLDRNLLGEMS